MTNIVTMTRSRKAGSYTLPDHVMNDLRLRMYDWRAADLAEAVGVSTSCVYAIRNGRTKWPRGATFFALLNALGVDLILVDSVTGKPLMHGNVARLA